MSYEAKSLADLSKIAQQLLIDFSDKRIVAFYGEMGAGKTTLIKELCLQLGVKEIANSPTFSIINEYLSSARKPIYHFDFYRIEDEHEVYDLGYEDYFFSDNYCFIEWPEKIPTLLPENVVKVHINVDEKKNRKISIVL